jgi:hypothetical protein
VPESFFSEAFVAHIVAASDEPAAASGDKACARPKHGAPNMPIKKDSLHYNLSYWLALNYCPEEHFPAGPFIICSCLNQRPKHHAYRKWELQALPFFSKASQLLLDKNFVVFWLQHKTKEK